jgi:5-methylcytosine-specific restriction endonuclease McrA
VRDRISDAERVRKITPEAATLARHRFRARHGPQSRRRRERERRADVRAVTARDLRRLELRQRGACAYCGELRPLTLEHVIPLARGGRHAIGNLLAVCGTCNSSKSARLLVEWRYRGRGRELVAA